MKKTLVLVALPIFLLAAWPKAACAQGAPETKPAEAISSPAPAQFDLEKIPVPVQRPTAVALKSAKGAPVVVALLDTTKSSARIRRKYTGIIIAQGKISVCGISLDAGGYGFGVQGPQATGTDNGRFALYTKGGDEVGECPAKRDTTLKEARPLAVNAGKGGITRLTFFGYFVELE